MIICSKLFVSSKIFTKFARRGMEFLQNSVTALNIWIYFKVLCFNNSFLICYHFVSFANSFCCQIIDKLERFSKSYSTNFQISFFLGCAICRDPKHFSEILILHQRSSELPRVEVESIRTNFELIFIEFFELFFTF